MVNETLDTRVGSASPLEDQASELGLFAIFLSKIKSMCPSTFDKCFNAIRKNMISNFRDVRVFDMECVKEARSIARGRIAASRAEAVEAMSDAQRRTYEARHGTKVPFTEEMVNGCREEFFSKASASVEEKMAYLAIALGYHLGNRPSETSSNGPLANDNDGNADEDHGYTVEDIQYQLDDGTFITGVEINETNRREIQFISVMVNSHKGETLRARSSKAFKRRQPNAIRKNEGGTMEAQLFDDMIEWPMIANLKKGDFFFSRNKNGRNLRLTTKKMTDMMKGQSARKQGVDPTQRV